MLSLFTPTIANGVVYVGALDFIYTQGDVVASPTTCSNGCEPLATLILGGANETPVAAAAAASTRPRSMAIATRSVVQ